jgi:glycosyltransferase involved in cell wall biosynthesis
MNPRVSVLLAVYNGEKYIKEAVESILNQSFKDFEFIIVDDGSTDSTAKILNEYKDHRIVRLVNEKNMGLVGSLNKGLHMAKGEFIARMDADDVSKKNRLEKQITFLDENPTVGVLGTYMEQVDENGKILSVFRPPLEHRAILLAMLRTTAIAHATVMMRKKVVLVNGGYDANFPHVEDTELWSRLILKTNFANLPEPLYVRRIHQGSIMDKYSGLQDAKSDEIRNRLLRSVIDDKILREDEIKTILNLRKKDNSIVNKLIQKLKNLLPAPWRHKLRSYLSF